MMERNANKMGKKSSYKKKRGYFEEFDLLQAVKN